MKAGEHEIPEGVKVLVATPNYTNNLVSEVHSNHTECAVSWSKWGIDFSWTLVGRTFVHFARSQMCRAAIDGGFTHILWLDDDAIIAPAVLPKFLAHEKDVVIAPYPLRKPPHVIGVLRARSGDFHDMATYYNMPMAEMKQGLVPVDGGGTHCMLVSIDCLLRKGDPTIPKLPNGLQKEVEGLSPEARRQFMDAFDGAVSEDLSFKEEDDEGRAFFMMPKTGTEDMLWCYRAKMKGIGIYCDTDVFAHHVGFAPIITEAFTERCEQLGVEGQARALKKNEVQISSITAGRNFESMDTEKTVNLI